MAENLSEVTSTLAPVQSVSAFNIAISEAQFFEPVEFMGEQRSRVVFSQQYSQLKQHHIYPKPAQQLSNARNRHRKVDDSLKLIDTLTSRSVDPLFNDAVLYHHKPQSTANTVIMRIITLILCIGIGIGTSIFVQQLHKQTRQKVRDELIDTIISTRNHSNKVDNEVVDLEKQIDSYTRHLNQKTRGTYADEDALMLGTTNVVGSGVTINIANPLETTINKSQTAVAENDIRVVTDADIQTIVNFLWHSGAEAIAVNGNRIGVQTSIRKAGQTILVGVKPIESPYAISAIGDPNALMSAITNSQLESELSALKKIGITSSIHQETALELQPIRQPEVTYAQEQRR